MLLAHRVFFCFSTSLDWCPIALLSYPFITVIGWEEDISVQDTGRGKTASEETVAIFESLFYWNLFGISHGVVFRVRVTLCEAIRNYNKQCQQRNGISRDVSDLGQATYVFDMSISLEDKGEGV